MPQRLRDSSRRPRYTNKHVLLARVTPHLANVAEKTAMRRTHSRRSGCFSPETDVPRDLAHRSMTAGRRARLASWGSPWFATAQEFS
ncbi:hypothetical protein V5799_020318 [Amblyomma americanum]|uniref:Uncharacterized protein n=1 Tax=Amblyomma americanum TaxID=6943 RepID=A0AAQ4EU61_AMBAM